MSVVVVSHNEGDNLHRTVDGLVATMPADGEVVVVDDGSTDGSADFLATEAYEGVRLRRPPQRLGAPAARNYGAAVARSDLLVFSDAHVRPDPGWFEPLASALDEPEVGAAAPAVASMHNRAARGFGMTWSDAALNVRWLGWQGDAPHEAPILCGCFVAIRRDAYHHAGGWDGDLVLWGGEDAELSMRLWTFGHRCVVVPTVTVSHLFRPSFPYSLGFDAVLRNMLHIAVVHLGERRLSKTVDHLRAHPAFPSAFAAVLEGTSFRRRDEVWAARRHDDDWFVSRFEIRAFD